MNDVQGPEGGGAMPIQCNGDAIGRGAISIGALLYTAGARGLSSGAAFRLNRPGSIRVPWDNIDHRRNHVSRGVSIPGMKDLLRGRRDSIFKTHPFSLVIIRRQF